MNIIVIGAVAAGTSAAAKARRNNDHANITIYEKDTFISYSGCGMPYFIGEEIDDVSELTPRDPAFFKKKYNIDIHIGHEVLDIDPSRQVVTVKNLQTEEVFEDGYDKLVLATGASPARPTIQGSEQAHVHYLRNIRDAIAIKEQLQLKKPKTAVIAGTGFIGLELLENFTNLGIAVQVVEVAPHITPNLDEDMATLLQNKLTAKGIAIHTGVAITEINEDAVLLSDGRTLDAEFVLLATGVRPNTVLAKKASVTLGVKGAIQVNDRMQTNVENIYACGDCVETFCSITQKPVYRPLGSTANKTGRIAGDVLSGGVLRYRGNLGTGIFKLFDLAVATTGLSEKAAIAEGYHVQVCHNIKPDKPFYMGGSEMVIKGIADRETGRLLGVQIIGGAGVDKRIDIFATLITYGATVEELFHLDLSYAPPFSTTKDPVHYTGMILDNAIHQNRPLVTAAELATLGDEVQLVDARSAKDYEKKGTVLDAVNIPHAKLREGLQALDPKKPTVTFCNKGVTGNAAQNILLGNGFESVYNLSGGHKFFKESK